MRFSCKTNPPRDVVSAVQQQTAEAAEIARIAGQDRLTDPRTNPAVRGHADGLRDEQHRRFLNAEHDRLLRRHSVEDERAEHAARALAAFRQALEASSPARSLLALHQSRTRFMGAALAASLALSVGSAIGMGEVAEDADAHAAVGYIAEVGLTGLATTVILYRAHLAQHGGKVTGWQSGLLWFLMIGPLVASVIANAFGSGPVGIACSVGAAAFSLLSCVIADASAAALWHRALAITDADEADLRAVAAGDDLFAAKTEPAPAGEPTRLAPPGHDMSEDDLVSLGFEAARVQDYLASRMRDVPAAGDVTRALPRSPQPALPGPVNRVPVLADPGRREVRAAIPTPALDQVPKHAAPEPRTPNRPVEPEVREPAEPSLPAGSEPARNSRSEPGTRRSTQVRAAANLGDRAAKKAAEIQQVLNLIKRRGYDTVTLGVVQDEFKFTKTTAYHRLTAARELWNQAAAS